VIELISDRRKKGEERKKKIDKTGRERMEGFVGNGTTKRNNRKEKVQ
jgi:hypothetical protein